MSHDLSALRLQLRDLHQQLAATLETFLAREPLLPGSLYTLRRRCGKPTCRCARGQLHASAVLAYRGQGGPRNLTVTPEQLPAVRELTDSYRRFRRARTQLTQCERQLRTLLDRIQAAQVEEGQRRFAKLRGPSSPRSRR